jgi:hypothetical protein
MFRTVRQARNTRRHALGAYLVTVTPFLVAALTLAGCLSGCSLVSLKSPERPLSTRDLNARILTRQFSVDFIAAVEQCADNIATNDPDPNIQRNALRWKLAATTQSQHAALQVAPMMAVLDTWTLAVAMKVFLSPGGSGDTLFGKEQPYAATVAVEFSAAAEAIARQLIEPREFPRYQLFVAEYTHDHPFVNLTFVRPSVVQLWLQKGGVTTPLLDSLGTIPEALADTSDRVQTLSETLPAQAVWRTQLALHDAGLAGGDLHLALRKLDERLARMSDAADTAPQVMRAAVADVRRGLLDVINRLDASSAATLATLRAERAALSATVSSERAAVVSAADAQRKAIARDVAGIADQVVTASGIEVRRLAREVTLLLIVLSVVLLGLPFAAGYLVGRALRAHDRGRAP